LEIVKNNFNDKSLNQYWVVGGQSQIMAVAIFWRGVCFVV
jgi:hypothetical protein